MLIAAVWQLAIAVLTGPVDHGLGIARRIAPQHHVLAHSRLESRRARQSVDLRLYRRDEIRCDFNDDDDDDDFDDDDDG